MKRSSGNDTSIVLSIIVSSEVNQSKFCEGPVCVCASACINPDMKKCWHHISLILDLVCVTDIKCNLSLSSGTRCF